ncbi:MAG TPA: DUF5076 domain-containing protein [Sphingomicrobium sp.]|nr:DUF5076 domain-containing protein [Sphingomicrobium sp.]
MPGKHFDLDALGIERGEFDEAVRVLMADGNVIVIDPEIVGEPFILGMMCVDIMRHGARAFARQTGMDEVEAYQGIVSGLMAELQHNTDEAGEPN